MEDQECTSQESQVKSQIGVALTEPLEDEISLPSDEPIFAKLNKQPPKISE
jgi:hypothetical protein